MPDLHGGITIAFQLGGCSSPSVLRFRILSISAVSCGCLLQMVQICLFPFDVVEMVEEVVMMHTTIVFLAGYLSTRSVSAFCVLSVAFRHGGSVFIPTVVGGCGLFLSHD